MFFAWFSNAAHVLCVSTPSLQVGTRQNVKSHRPELDKLQTPMAAGEPQRPISRAAIPGPSGLLVAQVLLASQDLQQDLPERSSPTPLCGNGHNWVCLSNQKPPLWFVLKKQTEAETSFWGGSRIVEDQRPETRFCTTHV